MVRLVRMIEIREIINENEISNALIVINTSFLTVADEFHLTKENAPTNAAFMKYEKLKESVIDGIKLFGLYSDQEIIGTICIEKAKDSEEIYYLERLAVLPDKRHSGYGKALMDFAIEEIQKQNGKKASIGIINENSRLKKWYSEYGFIEICVKEYPHLPFTVCFMEFKIKARIY
jgi:diamine N-acetyltransferase